MTLAYTTVTGTFRDGTGAGLSGGGWVSPSADIYDSSGSLIIAGSQIQLAIVAGNLQLASSGEPVTLVPTDTPGLSPAGRTAFWFYDLSLQVGTGQVEQWSFFLPSIPSTVDITDLAATGTPFLPLPSGSATAGYVPIATGTGETSAWGPAAAASLPLELLGDTLFQNSVPTAARLPGNTSPTKKFLTQTGTGSVSAAPGWNTIAAGDLPAATTGAQGAVELAGDLGGTASSPQVLGTHLASPLPLAQGGTGTSAGSTAALLTALGAAPLASPGLTGTPTAPTASALADSTQVATTAYADAAVAVETARAETAEGTLLPKSGGRMTGALAPAVVALADAATVTVNAALGNDFTLVLGGSRAIAAPSNPSPGQVIVFEIQQPASGGPFTPAFASGAGAYNFGAAGAPSWSTAASAVDQAAFRYSTLKSQWLYQGSALGF